MRIISHPTRPGVIPGALLLDREVSDRAVRLYGSRSRGATRSTACRTRGRLAAAGLHRRRGGSCGGRADAALARGGRVAMRITRTPRVNHFVQMANAAARDRRLSMRARGVLVFLLSLPDLVDRQRVDRGGDAEGRPRAVRAAMRELTSAGLPGPRVAAERARPLDDAPVDLGHAHRTAQAAFRSVPRRISSRRLPDDRTTDRRCTQALKNEDSNEDPLTPNAAALGEPCAKHKSLGKPHSRCRACGTAGRPKCDRESPAAA